MTNPDEERALEEWSQRLTQALQILDLRVDNDLLLKLADEASRAVNPSAGPISTFIVGYAAGRAATSGEKEATAAVRTAAQTALLVVEHGVSDRAPASDGWSDTAQ
ncbi:hypothetical protein B0I08_104181 [Glaciihabitans tibetensis]|uniref:DUF6457 domain-containing protein n=1 Tax=Glaciihabitans tibetensis TaxID=1266600 RepID=A0A2T0VE72_9MICO|nr:DUF6457 domain-containing protein [Glaciihabitans tibetensis]PRY68479.1 hypothetical protein B0I08_104181 [Glaciihabitans tibetensis]